MNHYMLLKAETMYFLKLFTNLNDFSVKWFANLDCVCDRLWYDRQYFRNTVGV